MAVAPAELPDSIPIRVAVVVPVYNEAPRLERLLADLIERQSFDELIVVDGGSTDAGMEIVCKHMASDARTAPVLIQSPGGRARQMHAGALAAGADVLLFLHADSELPPGAADAIRAAVRRGGLWGRFDVRLDGKRAAFRMIERMMNWRSRASGIATGDQGIFVRRDVYRLLGGFAPLPLMEDVELCARLKWFGRPVCLPGPLTTSARRWETRGVVRTVLLMWGLRLMYALGVSPARLARWYRTPQP